MYRLRSEDPHKQAAINVLLAIVVGLAGCCYLLGMASCVAQASEVPVLAQALPADVGVLADPLTGLLGRLGGTAALVWLIVGAFKRKAPYFSDGSEAAGVRLFALAMGLGVLAGLFGIVEPLPSKNVIAGEIAAGLGVGALSIVIHNAKKSLSGASAERKAKKSQTGEFAPVKKPE